MHRLTAMLFRMPYIPGSKPPDTHLVALPRKKFLRNGKIEFEGHTTRFHEWVFKRLYGARAEIRQKLTVLSPFRIPREDHWLLRLGLNIFSGKDQLRFVWVEGGTQPPSGEPRWVAGKWRIPIDYLTLAGLRPLHQAWTADDTCLPVAPESYLEWYILSAAITAVTGGAADYIAWPHLFAARRIASLCFPVVASKLHQYKEKMESDAEFLEKLGISGE